MNKASTNACNFLWKVARIFCFVFCAEDRKSTKTVLAYIQINMNREDYVMEFSSVNTIWVLLGAALVFFMQAGFAILESGLTRAKNAGNIIMKNLMDFSIGTPIYWLVGFGIMFGSSSPLFGSIDLFTLGSYADVLPSGVP